MIPFQVPFAMTGYSNANSEGTRRREIRPRNEVHGLSKRHGMSQLTDYARQPFFPSRPVRYLVSRVMNIASSPIPASHQTSYLADVSWWITGPI